MKLKLTDYTICGDCSNCGECCGDILHLSKKEIEDIKKYLEKNKLEQCNKGCNNLGCPFRDNFMKKCNIYEVRPEICRVFKCNKTPEDAYKTREITHKLLMNSADNRIIAKEEEMDYFDWLDRTLEEQLKILKGEDDERYSKYNKIRL